MQTGLDAQYVLARCLSLGAVGSVAKDDPDFATKVPLAVDLALERGRIESLIHEAERSGAADPVGEIDKIVDDLKESGGFGTVGFAALSGFRIAGRFGHRGQIEADAQCAMFATVLGTCGYLGDGLGLDRMRVVAASFEGGHLFGTLVGNFGLLFAVTEVQGPEVDTARQKIELAGQELESILQRVTGSATTTL
jgi:predicted regulator of Ras-like GTPase activity (Roadblock/LC7/MglB family)